MKLNSFKLSKLKFYFVLLLAVPNILNAQHTEKEHNKKEFKHHKLSIVMAHTHVPKATSSTSEAAGIIIPSWGFNYDYWFNHKWAIGLHNDMEITNYVIEAEGGTEIERERPYILAAVGTFKANEHIELIAGFGREFEKHHNFWVYRFGIEYEFEIGHHWSLAPSMIFDAKEDTYDSWTLGLVIGRKF